MAHLDPEKEKAAAVRATEVQSQVGHPQARWEALIERVQAEGVREFAAVTHDFLD